MPELKPNAVPNLTVAEAAWLAAAIDGEGCITFGSTFSKGSQKRYTTFRVTVYNTDAHFVEHAALLMGVKVTPHALSKRNKLRSTRPMLKAQCASRLSVRSILEQVMPYLLIKKAKAIEVVDWILLHPTSSRSDSLKRGWATRRARGYILNKNGRLFVSREQVLPGDAILTIEVETSGIKPDRMV